MKIHKRYLFAGSLTGIILLAFEYLYVTKNWFVLWPDLGTYLHIAGGMAVVLFHVGLFGQMLESMNFFAKGYVFLSYTALSATCWELFEYILGKIIHMNVQVSVENTMWDFVCGIFGGGLGYVAITCLNRVYSHEQR